MTDSAAFMAIASRWRDLGYAAELARLNAPANTIVSAGEGVASEQQSAGRSVRANCSESHADVPSPAEQTVAFSGDAERRRTGPAAS